MKDEMKLSRFDVIDYLDDGEAVIIFLTLAIEEGDEDCIAKCIKDVARGYDKIKGENKELKKQLKEANKVIKRELRRQSPKGGVLLGDMNDYLKKWGVK